MGWRSGPGGHTVMIRAVNKVSATRRRRHRLAAAPGSVTRARGCGRDTSRRPEGMGVTEMMKSLVTGQASRVREITIEERVVWATDRRVAADAARGVKRNLGAGVNRRTSRRRRGGDGGRKCNQRGPGRCRVITPAKCAARSGEQRRMTQLRVELVVECLCVEA